MIAAELIRKSMMALPATFLVWCNSASAGCNDDGFMSSGLGSHSHRRAVIGESADTRQRIFRRAGQRGTTEHEGEGKDEAEGPHLAVSRLGLPARAVLVGKLIPIRCFRMSAPKAGNGFVIQEKCFVDGQATKHLSENFNKFSRMR